MNPSEGSGDGERPARPPRDIQALLKFCVQESGSEDGTVHRELDPERRAWLEQALQSMTVDVVQEMLQGIQFITKELTIVNREEMPSDEIMEKILDAVQKLMDRTDDLDNAADFQKVGGFEILPPLLQSPHPRFVMKGADLVAALVQNHEYCQNAALGMKILDMLVHNLDSPSLAEEVKVKAVYAVSCLVRCNTVAQEVFEHKLNGYSVLLRAMQSSTGEKGPKLRTKSAFLLGSIMRGSAEVKERLFEMGYIEQLVGLLHMEHDSSHEYILFALLAFVSEFERGIKECRRPELQLKQLLQDRLIFLNHEEEHEEEEGYCKEILNLCFQQSSEGNQESER